MKTTEKISCEFFPPRTEQGEANFNKARRELRVLNPLFYSVTFGAGGSTQDKTVDTVAAIQKEGGVEAVPHISCITASRESIAQMLDTYRNMGVKRLVALRGDRPSGLGTGGGEFDYAADLVRFIRETSGDYFYIEVAAYPEVHPQAENASADLRHFGEKVKAGANAAITQYFFNADSYFQFIDNCQKSGLDIPIVPGIMPITNYTQLARFSDMCGAEIPRWLRLRLQGFHDDKASLRAFGCEVVTALCHRLLESGAPGLHFYTLNQSAAVLDIAKNLGILPD